MRSVSARIVTIDQDGMLWTEHPVYSQLTYCLDRVPAVVKAKPEQRDTVTIQDDKRIRSAAIGQPWTGMATYGPITPTAGFTMVAWTTKSSVPNLASLLGYTALSPGAQLHYH